jgi:peptidylprolyl isomerase
VTPKPLAPGQVPTLDLKDGVPTGFTPTATTPPKVSGLTVKVLKEGTGAEVQAGQSLTVDYLGQVYPDGTVFDESYSKKPATFSLDGVIAGWTQGLEGQKVGSRVVLVIPSVLGYGAAGQGEDIPPNADLIFVVDIKKAE